jgi:UDP-2-acetamido-3-amino-2,3-dideoxy-glucuronate N-acetyltransferase
VCGHTLGQYSFVGAGSVVTRDVPNFAMVMGNPARIRGWLCYCGIRLGLSTSVSGSEEATCPACSRRYTRNGTEVDMIESERRYVEC